MQRLRRIGARLLLVCLGFALALSMVEIGVRMLHLVPARFWVPDPLLGSRLIPNKEGWWTQEEREFRVRVRINSQGLRDIEHTLAKPPGVFRILLLGDSFIEAMQVPLEDTITRRLEDELNREPGPVRYEVIGMGVSGYGTASEFLAYREDGRRYDPDLVVLAFYPGNDVRNNSSTLEPLLVPVYAEDGTLVRVTSQEQRGEGRESFVGRLLADSQAYRFVRKKVLTEYPGLTAWLVKIGFVQKAAVPVGAPQRNGVPVDYQVYAPLAAAQWSHAWRHTEALLQAFEAETKADGGKLVILIVAGREQVQPETWQDVVAAYPAMKGMRWDLLGPEYGLSGWCETQQIPCLRQSVVFRAAGKTGDPLHYRYDRHWTAAGHALAAETLAKFLRTEGFLPGSVGIQG